MPGNGYEAQKRWNASNYKQINISVPPGLATAFRAACERNGASMREVFIDFMNTYTETPPTQKPPKGTAYDNRKRRRKAIAEIATQLTAIRDAEEQYRDSIPENLRNSSRYSAADEAIELFNEALDLLNASFT